MNWQIPIDLSYPVVQFARGIQALPDGEYLIKIEKKGKKPIKSSISNLISPQNSLLTETPLHDTFDTTQESLEPPIT